MGADAAATVTARNRAIDYLGRTAENRVSDAGVLETDAGLAPLRGDPCWAELIKRPTGGGK